MQPATWTAGMAVLIALIAVETEARSKHERPEHTLKPLAATVAPKPPRAANPVGQQLMITDLRVVEDRTRTNPRSGRRGVWSFKYLMEQMSGGNDAAAFTQRWLELWAEDQNVNGFTAPARPAMRELVLDPWLAASGGQRLDLDKAPFKLLAVVNRMDLRVHVDEAVVTAGEGRFVFGVLGPDGRPLPPIAGTVHGGFVVILEYELPASNMQELGDWAMRWKSLERYPVGSRDYNRALEQVTRRFTDRGEAPGKPNGSPLNQIRSNEVALALPWELREFVIDAQSGFLRPHTVALTPDTLSLNGTPAFADFINTVGPDILAGTAMVAPESFGASALSGPFFLSDFPDVESRTFTTNLLGGPFFDIPWSAAGIDDNNERHAFALNTCNGCHRDETGTTFVHVGFPAASTNRLPRTLGAPAELSGFLTGIATPDPVEPDTERHFDDLKRRLADFRSLCATFGTAGEGPGPRGAHIPRFVH